MRRSLARSITENRDIASQPRMHRLPRHAIALGGEIVLDLGSGGGIDVLLSARRVGPD